MKKALVAVVASCLLLGTAAGPAEAHVKTYSTQININVSGAAISGGVGPTTLPTRCWADRLVTIRDETDGHDLGTDLTDPGTGEYVFQGTFDVGHAYSASVSKLRIKRNQRHKHFCSGVSAGVFP